MKFSASTLAATIAVAMPLASTGFSSLAFTRQAVTIATPKSQTFTTSQHGNVCDCACCSGLKYLSLLRMSEGASENETVPAEVESVEGTISDEEVHNKERPARGSGIKKHKTGKQGTPLSELQIGSTVQATVKTITTYGAFLDIGAASDALLHVSRMSDDFTSNPEDIVSVGQVVDVRIVTVDLGKNQIAVTMQSEAAEAKAQVNRAAGGGRRKERPQRSGGDRAAQRTTMDALSEKGFDDSKFIEGEVVNTLDFGAFVRFDASQLGEGLEGELDGLVHISALTEGRAESVSSIVSAGDKVQVRVKSIDCEGGKVSLSMISKEAEESIESSRRKSSGGEGGANAGGGRSRGPKNAMFRSDEMGASDWKDSLDKYQEAQPEFKNSFIVVEKKKQTA